MTLCRAFQTLPEYVRLSLHICGSGVHNLLAGEKVINEIVAVMAKRGGRVQLNFNQTEKPVDLNLLKVILNRYPEMQVITQHNEENASLWEALTGHPNHAVLFDASGGRGILEKQWPTPLPGVACGYAGGLGPNNIRQELSKISTNIQDGNFWVDMESSLRIIDEEGFDKLDIFKCEACLVRVAESIGSYK